MQHEVPAPQRSTLLDLAAHRPQTPSTAMPARGEDLYGAFVREHNSLPSPEQARAIGLLLGRRVKATDGKLYPPKSKEERAFDRRAKQRQEEFARRYDIVCRIVDGMQALAEAAGENNLSDVFLAHQRENIALTAEKALHSLIRISSEAGIHVAQGFRDNQYAGADREGRRRQAANDR